MDRAGSDTPRSFSAGQWLAVSGQLGLAKGVPRRGESERKPGRALANLRAVIESNVCAYRRTW